MEITKARLRSTSLNDRTLWFDGESSYDPEKLLTSIRKYDVKYVDHMNNLVHQYNQNVPRADEIKVKNTCKPLSTEWTLPDEYKNLDVVQYLIDKHDSEIITELLSDGSIQESEASDREVRLAEELSMYKKRNLFDVLRTIIFIINTLSAKDIVWGVGRGSSVSSYVLFVIGVHDVDSYAYDLDIDDFLHD